MFNKNISSAHARFKTYSLNYPWRARAVIACSTIILLLVIVRLILSPTIIYSANNWLKEQDIDSSIEDVKIGLFNGTVSLINAKGSQDNKTVFDIGLVEIHWRWAPLSNKTVEVTEVIFDQINLDIEQYTDAIIISGIKIPLNTEPAKEAPRNTDTEEDDKQLDWAAALGSVTLKELDVCFLQHSVPLEQASEDSPLFDYCVDLQEMTWKGSISYGLENTPQENGDLPLSSTGNFTLNGLTVRDNKLDKILLASKANTLSEVKISGLNNIQITEIDMNDLSALERVDQQHIDTVRFKQLSIKDIKLTDLNSLTLGDIQLHDPGLYLVKNSEEDWEHQTWLPDSEASDNDSTKNSAATKKQDPLSLTVNNISINAPDFCYLEKNTTQYYCFTAQALVWAGDIKLDNALQASGDVSISQPKIHNHSINRDLLTLKSVNLKQLSASDFNNIKLKEFSMENFSALQRGMDESDMSVVFNLLTINDVNYSKDRITIDTIDLRDISSNFSKNEDGRWEHDKWVVSDNKETPKTSQTKDQNEQKKSAALQLSLNQLTISTENKNLFTDNSTKPATVAGLDKLSFDLRNLDAAQPDSDSQFNLSAKTTRHSTIDLEGTFRPFADKVSMTADGKLKGFDLRAASPSAHKAIGHIIKSGQLDADITLRATDGILDSNIALSLYHFNLKALSKKDAKALDDLFGMPINQSLVLLRDKDDSIHLDIPITGDVNNPDFNPMDAIIKATTKATTVTLITFYTPYGLVYAGGNVLFDLATALNFDPIIFNAGSAKLSDENKDSLISLARLLTEKPQVRLTLCGITNMDDYDALFPDSKLSKEERNSELKLSADKVIALDQLAKQRQVDIKNYLVNEKSIEHERLILCTPEFNSDKDAISGVEINI